MKSIKDTIVENVSYRQLEKSLRKHHDSDTDETWFEGYIGRHRVRFLQEEPGDDKWWSIEIDRKLMSNADGRPMSFNEFGEMIMYATDELNEIK